MPTRPPKAANELRGGRSLRGHSHRRFKNRPSLDGLFFIAVGARYQQFSLPSILIIRLARCSSAWLGARLFLDAVVLLGKFPLKGFGTNRVEPHAG